MNFTDQFIELQSKAYMETTLNDVIDNPSKSIHNVSGQAGETDYYSIDQLFLAYNIGKSEQQPNKKIYVTVAEFLTNGGKLEIGRHIFERPVHLKTPLFEGEFKGFNVNGVPLIGVGEVPVSIYMITVEIDCVPIYK